MFEDLKRAAGITSDKFSPMPGVEAEANRESLTSKAESFTNGTQAPSDQGGFSVVLENAGEDKIRVIRAIREITGYDLSKAKNAAESAPCTILTTHDRYKADNAKVKLEEAGAIASIPQQHAAAESVGSYYGNRYFDVLLEGFGDNKIAVIKVVRETTGFGLKEAKELVEKAPTVVEKSVSQARAQEIKHNLETAGAAASTVESAPPEPKQASTRFEFGLMDGYAQYSARLRLLTKEEGGRHTPIFEGYHPTFSCDICEDECLIHMPPDREMMVPGDDADLHIDLPQTISVAYGQRFKVLENGRLVAEGYITDT